jgi:putative membrane protein
VKSTSYDRYWEGRKLFAAVTSNVLFFTDFFNGFHSNVFWFQQIRNISRVIWVSVALPPTTEQPPHMKGKTPTTDVTLSQLRRRKVDALKLALSFAFAVKHYLRGEDGMDWEDYADIFPASFCRHYDPIYVSPRTPPSYDATNDRLGNHSEANSPDSLATKRVRPKRSSPGPNTPLLGGTHHAIHMGQSTMPLPLMFVVLFYGSSVTTEI